MFRKILSIVRKNKSKARSNPIFDYLTACYNTYEPKLNKYNRNLNHNINEIIDILKSHDCFDFSHIEYIECYFHDYIGKLYQYLNFLDSLIPAQQIVYYDDICNSLTRLKCYLINCKELYLLIRSQEIDDKININRQTIKTFDQFLDKLEDTINIISELINFLVDYNKQEYLKLRPKEPDVIQKMNSFKSLVYKN